MIDFCPKFNFKNSLLPFPDTKENVGYDSEFALNTEKRRKRGLADTQNVPNLL